MDFQNLFLSAQGRINRKPWWIGMVILFLVNVGLAAILGAQSTLAGLVGLVLIIPGVMVSIKRCHDRGKSGWWCLLFIIPLVGAIWALIDLGILSGEEGPNQYGPDPLAGA